MENTKYNGWTNYATWRVSLENYSNIDIQTIIDCYSENTVYELSEMMKEEMEEKIECDNDLAYDYALAFLSDVNYYEIASHIMIETIDNICYSNDISSETSNINGYVTISKRINDELIKATFDDITINDVLQFINS